METGTWSTRSPMTLTPHLSPSTAARLEVKERLRGVAPTGLWLVAALLMSLGLGLSHSPLVPLPGVITLLLVPGAAVMSVLKTRPANTAGRIVLAVCLSMTTIMVIGCVASLLGPHVGVAHPLNALPESVIWVFLALLVLVMGAANHRDPVTWIFEGVRTSCFPAVVAGALLVLLSILGAAQLNYTGNYHLALFAAVLDVVLLLAGVVGGWSRTSRWPLYTLLYSASLALLVSLSLRGAHLYGWDIQQEFGVASGTIRAGVWVVPANHDPYASMLSLTVLPAVLHSLVKLRLLAFFQLVVPAILALLPVAMFATVRNVPRWITSGRPAPRPGLAFAVVVGLIVSSTAFAVELASITRQAMALTMLAALVMVLFDRTMSVRASRIVIGVLFAGISFTHYSTSYLLAVIVLAAWIGSLAWSRGWLGTPKARIEKHRYDVRSRKIINVTLVVVALVSAFGWNLAITRNSALSAPSSALVSKGVGLVSSTNAKLVSLSQVEHLVETELHKSDRWISPVSGSSSIHLTPATAPRSVGLVPSFAALWNDLTLLCQESVWITLTVALLYGMFRLGRRRSYQYSADLVGLGLAGLMIGFVLRFSGTLANFYAPERAAIFTAIVLAAPVTLFLDDLVVLLHDPHIFRNSRLARLLFSGGFLYLAILLIAATGLGAVFFLGGPQGSLSAGDLNVQEFTVSTPDFVTALWLRNNVPAPNIVQSDLFGRLVLLSVPGGYGVVNEIVPPEVDRNAYIYLSSVNLVDHSAQVAANNGQYVSMYHTNVQFFNQNFYVVYSTGTTRVYHGAKQ
jgi:uncharacterized membrane protein